MGNASSAASAADRYESACNGRVEGGEELVGVVLLEDQRRPDLDDVAEGAGIAGQEAAVLELVHHLDRAIGIGLARRAGLDHLHADEQAMSAHVADRRAGLLALAE